MGSGAAFPYPEDGSGPITVHTAAGDAADSANGVGAMMQEARGFTLIELMTTLAVLAVSLAVGVPAFAGLKQRMGAASAYHLLTGSLAVARMSAVKHGSPVSVCPSSDGLHCRNDVVWDNGWIVFLDPERNDQPASETAVLQRIDGIGNGLMLRSTGGRTLVRFTPDGWSYGSNVSVRLCAEDEARLLGKVVVNNAGRPRTEQATNEEPCPYRLR